MVETDGQQNLVSYSVSRRACLSGHRMLPACLLSHMTEMNTEKRTSATSTYKILLTDYQILLTRTSNLLPMLISQSKN